MPSDTTTTQAQVSLASLKPGVEAIITRLDLGRHAANRLAVMGFTLGARVKVLQNYGHGPLIVLVRGTRVALGRGEASRIFVSEQR